MSADWIQTFTGRKVYPLNLRPEDISIVDIAHSLSNMCRFSGHTRRFYSVAEHSIRVAENCPEDDALWGLLHDATEAYLIDVPRPLKHRPEFAFYREAEARAALAIAERFELTPKMPASVKIADARMLATEARDLMDPLHPEWRVMAEPYTHLDMRDEPLSRGAIEFKFRLMFVALGGCFDY